MPDLTGKFHINFMGQRKLWAIISLVLVLASLADLLFDGLNLGIDFTGGTIVEVAYQEAVELDQVRKALASSPFSEAIVQYYGTARDVLIRVAPRSGMNSAEISNQLIAVLRQSGHQVDLRRVEFVGPQVGEELTEDGGLAMLVAMGMILIYVAVRFQLKFSIGAIAALLHDVIITFGFFSLTGKEFDLTVLAAILAVIGYSLNDTIVVFDRIRENFHRMRRREPVEVMNVSINQTLSRTIMSSFTTLLVLIALFLFGGEIIHGFATALIVGIVVGTYSSIFIASPITLALGITRRDLLPVEKEGADREPTT